MKNLNYTQYSIALREIEHHEETVQDYDGSYVNIPCQAFKLNFAESNKMSKEFYAKDQVSMDIMYHTILQENYRQLTKTQRKTLEHDYRKYYRDLMNVVVN